MASMRRGACESTPASHEALIIALYTQGCLCRSCIASHSCAMGYVGSAFHAAVSSVHTDSEHSCLLWHSTGGSSCFSDSAAAAYSHIPSGSGGFTNGDVSTAPYTSDPP